MKLPTKVAISIIVLGGGWLALSAMPSDTVVSRYETVQDARADLLFDRGWLPDILPASARKIRTENNLDLNTSEGEFHFSAADFPKFASQMNFEVPATKQFGGLGVDRMRSEGFEVRAYSGANSTWVFFCKASEGYCRYKMRPREA